MDGSHHSFETAEDDDSSEELDLNEIALKKLCFEEANYLSGFLQEKFAFELM